MSIPGTQTNPPPAPAARHLIDAFGTVVTPHISDNMSRHIAEELPAMARNHENVEERVNDEIANGPTDQSWINNALSKAGPL